jgi:hypothetical protein
MRQGSALRVGGEADFIALTRITGRSTVMDARVATRSMVTARFGFRSDPTLVRAETIPGAPNVPRSGRLRT